MARRRKKRRDDEPSYWLSYSDMMAGLLLMFVIIISFTMMQAKTKFEADEKELKAQQERLTAQQTQLEDQNTTMSEQSTTLSEQESQLAAQKAALEKQKEELEAQKKQLEAAQATMNSQQSALSDAESTLTSQSAQLKAAQDELKQKEAALATQQDKLQSAESLITSQQQQMEDLVGVRKELVEQLKKAFEGTANVTVDSSGSIMFESNVLFDFNASELTDDGKTFLKQFLPQYFNILLSDQFKDYVSEIIIEGHTDTDGDYLFNLQLSQERALAVATYCLTDDGSVLPTDQVETLRKLVTANGKSYSDPIYNADGTVNKDASRRVEFKFRLKDEEMVDQMLAILNGTESGTQAASSGTSTSSTQSQATSGNTTASGGQ